MACQGEYNEYTKFYQIYKEELKMDTNAMIGAKIANLRKQHGFTQEQLAEKLDTSIKHCSAVERGQTGLSLEKLIEISNLFVVSLDYLAKEPSTTNKSFDCLCHNFPPSIINIMRSGNENEMQLLREYLLLYLKLRNSPK